MFVALKLKNKSWKNIAVRANNTFAPSLHGHIGSNEDYIYYKRLSQFIFKL